MKHNIVMQLLVVLCMAGLLGVAQAAVDLTKLPLGDNLLSTAPKVGYLWPCITGAGGGGAFTNGPWFNADGLTYDLTAKATVDGAVSWSNQYTSTVVGSSRVFVTNDLPNHTTGIYPIASTDDAYLYDRNPNSIKSQQIQFSLNANPTVAAQAYCTPGAVGILLTGAVLFNAVDAEDRDAVAHEVQDSCQGHPQESGVYHYHSVSTCSNDATSSAEHSDLIGYAVDGFGIYGHRGENGVELSSADLDECHGHTHTITWNGAQVSMYHYHATWDFPYTVGCMRGTYDQSVVMAISNGTSSTTSTPAPVASRTPTPSKTPTPRPTSNGYTPTPTMVLIPITSHTVTQKTMGTAIKENAGSSLAYMGDINADNVGDYAIGSPLYDVKNNDVVLKDAGRVLIISGKDGSTLFTVEGERRGDYFGAAMASGRDIDQDGINDLIVGAYLADAPSGVKDVGNATVFSGKKMSILFQKTGRNAKDYFGYSVALIGDVNGDDGSDVAIGAYLSDKNNNDGSVVKNVGSVHVFSGGSGVLYRTYWGAAANSGLGFSIASSGDIDADGFDDVIIGAPFSTDFYNLKKSGSAYIYSPHKDTVLAFMSGPAANSAFGSSVSGAGDVNHDGVLDVIVGAKLYDVPIFDEYYIKKGFIMDAGAAFVYSTNPVKKLMEINGKTKSENVGVAVSSVGDINGDDYDDVAVGVPNMDKKVTNTTQTIKDVGRVAVFTFLSEEPLFSEESTAAADHFGSVISHGDVNHDGTDELIVSAPQAEAVIDNVIVKDAGAVSVISATP